MALPTSRTRQRNWGVRLSSRSLFPASTYRACVETTQNSEDTDPILSFTDIAKTKDTNPAEVGDAVHTTLNKLGCSATQNVLGSVLVNGDASQ